MPLRCTHTQKNLLMSLGERGNDKLISVFFILHLHRGKVVSYIIFILITGWKWPSLRRKWERDDDRLSQVESIQNIPLPLREMEGDTTAHLIRFLRIKCQVSTSCSTKSTFHHLTSYPVLHIHYSLALFPQCAYSVHTSTCISSCAIPWE